MAKAYKNIVIAVSMNEACQETLKGLAGNLLFQNAKVHLVHTVAIYTYMNELSLNTYPAADQYPAIQELVSGYLSTLEAEIFSDGAKPMAVNKVCRFHHSPKEDMLAFLKDANADLVVVATRGKHGIEGLFASSFTEYLSKFAPCDILVLREKKKA